MKTPLTLTNLPDTTKSSPLQIRPYFDVPRNTKNVAKVGGFLIEDVSDDDLSPIEEPPHKRQKRCQSMEKDNVELETTKLSESSVKEPFTRILDRVLGERKTHNLTTLTDDTTMDGSLHRSEVIDITSDNIIRGFEDQRSTIVQITTCAGRTIPIKSHKRVAHTTMEKLVAARSITKAGHAQKSFYGIPLYELIEEVKRDKNKDQQLNSSDIPLPTVETHTHKKDYHKSLMWTEKYRAKNFLDLVGDNRTHRQVLRWLKAWDPIVFPASRKRKQLAPAFSKEIENERQNRKILLLAGPPGLGKTTLAHVCARQAGYEIVEINASDERSKNAVNNRIKTSLGTESVKTGSQAKSKSGQSESYTRPLCVIVDEVDGVDGGFIKAIINLCLLDQKNTSTPRSGANNLSYKNKKVDKFRFLRPIILICNDVYHSTLRPLRNSNFVEIIHVQKPNLSTVALRMKSIFEKEAIICDDDAVRRLCEVAWEVNATDSRKGKEGACEGDLRGVLIVGEWASRKLKATTKNKGDARLTRQWIEQNMTDNLSHIGDGAQGVARGGTREVVNRVFLEGAGFPQVISSKSSKPSNDQPQTQLGLTELAKKAGMDRLRMMIESNDINRIILDVFSQYPNQSFNDDSMLSKPDAAYEWLHFYDSCSSQVYSNQNFELAPYLSQPILACHNLFASSARHSHNIYNNDVNRSGEEEENKAPLPFTGPRADYEAYETEKSNRAILSSLIASFDATNLRNFQNPENVAIDFLPCLVRMLSPEVKPIIVGGGGGRRPVGSVRRESEKIMVERTVNIMNSFGIVFEQGKLESDHAGNTTSLVYRMKPPLDDLVFFETANTSTTSRSVRYAVRQVLDQEYQKRLTIQTNPLNSTSLYRLGENGLHNNHNIPKERQENTSDRGLTTTDIERDFFGRIITGSAASSNVDSTQVKKSCIGQPGDHRVWVTYHEGFSNAVRKPLSIENLLHGL
ncbi:Chromosome transmission fidelity protein 18 [Erysiphe neolycopersici]|uniref:Chromosome transmission fidelity protein 18 n=1 Tax=Erysiphe neolycopersici TaxID=212602 RepID=A0A420HW69_9PEZI|nr:Chromosome transmission fidelity protein 18 [Erysiphe neolycopersici]